MGDRASCGSPCVNCINNTYRSLGSCFYIIILLVCVSCIYGEDPNGYKHNKEDIIEQCKLNGGILCVSGEENWELSLKVAQNPKWVVQVLETNNEKLKEVSKMFRDLGVLGRNVYVKKWDGISLPQADHLLDILILSQMIDQNEIKRVISPIHGIAFVDSKIIKKPVIRNSDWWTHRVHDGSNNPVSLDTAFQLPAILQYMAMPFYTSYQGTMIVDDGVRFELYDWLNRYGYGSDRKLLVGKLLARNLYNGQIMWKDDLPRSIEPDAQICFSYNKHLFLSGDNGCEVLVYNGKTGAKGDPINFPDDADRRVTWLAESGGLLYALLSDWPQPETIGGLMKHTAVLEAQGKAKMDGVRYEIKKHKPNYKRTGTFVCWDIEKKVLIWEYKESRIINHQDVVLVGGRVYYFCEGKYMACLNEGGRRQWVNKDPAWLNGLEKPYKWLNYNVRNMSMLIASQDGHLIFQKNGRNFVFNAHDGRLLWASGKDKLLRKQTLQSMCLVNRSINGIIDLDTGEELDKKIGDSMGGHCGYRSWVPALNGRLGNLSFFYKAACSVPTICAGGVLNYFPSVCNCDLFERGAAGFVSGKEYLDKIKEVGRHPLEIPSIDSSGQKIQEQYDVSLKDGDWNQYRGGERHLGGIDALALKTPKVFVAEKLTFPFKVPDGHFQNRWRWLDRATPPVTTGDLTFYGLSTGELRALSISAGKEVWSYHCGGPIYTAPVVFGGNIYVGCGDGWVYCCDGRSGQLRWRWRAAPIERDIMIYDKLVSTWPVMAILEVDGMIYGNAGIQGIDGWQSFALDAVSGEPIWTHWNDPVELPRGYSWLDGTFGLTGYPSLLGRNLMAKEYAHYPGIFDAKTGLAPSLSNGDRTTLIAWPGSTDLDCITPDEETVLRGGSYVLTNQDLRKYKYGANIRSYKLSDYQNEIKRKQLSKKSAKRHAAAAMLIPRSALPPAILGDQWVTCAGDHVLPTLSLWNRRDLESNVVDIKKGASRKIKRGDSWSIKVEANARWFHSEKIVNGVVLQKDVVLVLEGVLDPKEKKYPKRLHSWTVKAYERLDGRLRWSVSLPCEPILNGMAGSSSGALIVSLRDGNVVIIRETDE